MDLGSVMPASLRDAGMDRKTAVRAGAAAVGFLVVLWMVWSALGALSDTARKVEAARSDLEDFRVLAREYAGLRAEVDTVSRRAFAGQGESTIALVEEAASRIGVSGNLASIEPGGERTVRGYTERTFTVEVEGVTLNQLVNLLYLLEKGRALVRVRDFSMESTFEDPEILDASMTIVRVMRLPG